MSTTNDITETTTAVTATVDAYIDMWNERDPARRRSLIEQAWDTDARYVDPLLEADGHDALDAMVTTVHDHYPGHVFRRTSAVDVHHDRARFGWELVAPSGEVFVGGIDVATTSAGGRLTSVTGFFGDLPGTDESS